MELRDLGFLLFLAVIFVWVFTVGAITQEKVCRKEAVAAGVAHWTVDAEGKTKFEYNK